MEINEFAKKVCNAIKRELGEEYRVELKEVRKNNGVVLHGILASSPRQNVVPTIYLEGFLEAYESGTAFAAIIRQLVAIYREDVPGGRIDMDFFKSFEKVRDRICYRLIGRRENEELLRHMPHMEFLDLAVCFFYAYNGEALGEGMIPIQDSHVRMWQTSAEELYRLAEGNTPGIFPWECNSLENILSEGGRGARGEDSEAEEGFGEVPMRVLSNQRKLHGAACMLYPGVLESIAAGWQRGFYILPSSIHEVILLMDDGNAGKAEELKKMIREVNSTQVAPEEVLSDNLYHYDCIDKKVKIIF